MPALGGLVILRRAVGGRRGAEAEGSGRTYTAKRRLVFLPPAMPASLPYTPHTPLVVDRRPCYNPRQVKEDTMGRKDKGGKKTKQPKQDKAKKGSK